MMEETDQQVLVQRALIAQRDFRILMGDCIGIDHQLL